MNPYLRNESEAEEFDNTVDIALKLFSRSKKRRQIAERDILTLGAKSVRPIAYTIELSLWDKSMSDDDINERAEDVSDIILQIGKDVLPDLNYLATNGSCNMYVNEWAQDLIFKVMDVDGEEKQKACHHFGFLLYSKEDKNILICLFCGSRIPAEKKSDSDDE
jgi:hypothetical protein